MSALEIVVAFLRGTHVATLLSLFGTLVFLTLVVPSAMAEAAVEAPHLRRLLLNLARISAAFALIIGMAWLVLESAVIAGAGSVATTLHAVPVVALRTQFGQWLLVRGILLLVVLPLLGPWRAWTAIAAVLAAAALAVEPILGHAGALGGSVGITLIVSELLHLLAAAAWLGSLLPLFVTIGTLPPTVAATACRSFTPVGLSAVLVLGGDRHGTGGRIHGWPAGAVRHRLWPGRSGEARAVCCAAGIGRAQSPGPHRSAHRNRAARRTAPHARIRRD
jgi:putative copper export protein